MAQTIKGIMRTEQGWYSLNDMQRESLDLIATKMARILSGDANEPDHWEDIAGYAMLPIRRP
jgi:hypothetical protein